MKKTRFLGVLLALLLICCLSTAAFAADPQLYHVTDEAELFTIEQWQALEQRATDISEKYNFGVYIITVEDFRDYSNTSNIEKFAVKLYDDYGLGYGDDRAGVTLLLSM